MAAIDMASTFVFSSSIQWTPPSAPTNSGQSSFVMQANYSEHNVGTLGIPSGTAPATSFPIPFGTVNSAKLLAIKNMTNADIDLKINGSADPVTTIAPNGMIIHVNPIDPTTGLYPVESASIIILGTPTTAQSVQYWVIGD